jgi:[ribosomal protein S18]-alanine N-acetyltransferase
LCYEPEIAYSQRELQRYLRFPGAGCVVAEIAGTIAGFCLTEHEGGAGHVVTIDVLEPYRRHGAGSALLREMERRLVEEGVREIELETATDNESAIAFWQNHGYRKCGIRKKYYPGGRDAYTMRKGVAGQDR